MIRFLTAGESHGSALVAVIEGLPSNLPVSIDYINMHLKRRQMGYGRGLRMKIESDTAEVLSGVRNGKTIGSPVALLIKNKDWENWKDVMSIDKVSGAEKISVPRPGHTDLTGTLKYNYSDIRNSIERSSARETAARTAAGTLARLFLESFGISIGSYVESVGGIFPDEDVRLSLMQNPVNRLGWSYSLEADRSEVRVLERKQEEKIIRKIKSAKKKGDTLGGTFVVIAAGLPPGLGSFMHYDRKLDASLAAALMSVNAVKSVEIGSGFSGSTVSGSFNNDEIILKDGRFIRKTNYAGGIEGGISTGMPLIIRAAMKPIATLMNPVKTVDLKSMKPVEARRERSDFTAVPACSVIGEAVTAWTLAEHFSEKFGGDSIEEIRDNYTSYTKKLFSRIKRNFG